VGEIIAERRATSNRIGGRHHPGFAGDFLRNQQLPRATAQSLSILGDGPPIADSTRTEIVKRSHEMQGFVILPRRWVVERTFSWFGRNRRLAKDFENLAETLGAFLALASIQLALRGLARA
jgi:hypothetical protein